MRWYLWALLLVPQAIPVGSLMIDRIFGIPARRQWIVLGLPAAAVFFGALGYALNVGDPIAELVGWGALAGALATVLLDAVRLTGVHFGAFPADMPQLFGTIALGLAPRFQRNMMKAMVVQTSALPEPQRKVTLEARLKALARLPAPRRQAVMAGMMAGLGELPDANRQAMLQTQMGVLSELPGEERRALMVSMDAAMAVSRNGEGPLPYGQPRGMPRIPMATFRSFAKQALPRTWREASVSEGLVLGVGYLWHFIIGATSLGVPFALLFGYGSSNDAQAWGIALGWGIFIWAGMMVAMPPMMPMIRFPRWFPGVPFLAHLAFAVPFALISVYLVGDAAHLHSLVGALT